MVVDGVHVRFCQQCGKFQELSDFDGGRKTCRARLQVHNQLRRRQSCDSKEYRPPQRGAKAGRASSNSVTPDRSFSSHTYDPSSDGCNNSVAGSPPPNPAPASQVPAAQDLAAYLMLLEGQAMPTLAVDGGAYALPLTHSSTAVAGLDHGQSGMEDGWVLEAFVDDLAGGTEVVHASDDAQALACFAAALPSPAAMLPVAPARAMPCPNPRGTVGNALQLLDLGCLAPPPPASEPQQTLVTASLKLFNVHPCDLPPSVRSELEALVADGEVRRFSTSSAFPGSTAACGLRPTSSAFSHQAAHV